MTTIGIIGAGTVGAQVARRALATGHPVVIANTRGPDSLAGLIADLGPGARAATPEAASAGDIVVVASDLPAYGVRRTAAQMRQALADAHRYRDR